MKVPCKNIPTYNFEKKEWTTTSFKDQYEFGTFLKEKVFKEPGEYQFEKELTKVLWPEKANIFNEKGRYTEFYEDTEEYWEFWDEEEMKCRLGVIWNYKDRVYYTTSDFYFLLNYIVIENKEDGYSITFMDPRDGQYHMMLYEKIAECFDLNSVVLKRRQFAYSICHVAKSLSILYFESNKRTKWFASDSKYLDNVNGSWKNLDIAKKHLNANTGWYRDFSPDSPGKIQQRVQVKDSSSSGWHWEGNESSIITNTMGKDPASGVGGATFFAWYEEGGIAPTANITLQFLEPAIMSGSRRVGTFCIGGSVGDLSQCKPLKDFMYNPSNYGFLSVPTKWWDESGVTKESGLFIPAQYGMPEATDEHGNSLPDLALEILRKTEHEGWKVGEMKGNVKVMTNEPAKKDLPEEEYTIWKSQQPKNIKEAFAFRGISKFNPQKCEKKQKELEILQKESKLNHKKGLLYQRNDGSIYLKDVKEILNAPSEMRYPVDPKIIDKRGLVTIVEPYNPKCSYYAGVDSIEADITPTSESLFSIHIYRRSYVEFDRTTGKQKVIRGKIVAWWTGRFDSAEETNDHAMYLLMMYKAKACCERNKPNFINHCRRHQQQGLIALTKDLPFDKDIDITGRENGNYGIWRDSAGKVMNELIRAGKEYLNGEFDVVYLNPDDLLDNPDTKLKKIIRGYDFLEDYWLLEELKLYNGEDNADRVDSFLYAIHFGTAEELSFANKIVETTSVIEKTKKPLYQEKPVIRKYGAKVKKYGQNRNLLNY